MSIRPSPHRQHFFETCSARLPYFPRSRKVCHLVVLCAVSRDTPPLFHTFFCSLPFLPTLPLVLPLSTFWFLPLFPFVASIFAVPLERTYWHPLASPSSVHYCTSLSSPAASATRSFTVVVHPAAFCLFSPSLLSQSPYYCRFLSCQLRICFTSTVPVSS